MRTHHYLNGNCWVGNRGIGTVVKIGLLENEGFYDRNHNGIIETSRDLDGNGLIEGSELLDWGMDECVLWEIIVIPGLEGTYHPGEYTGRYSGTPGPRGIAVDRYNNVWAGTYGTSRFYYINGTNGEIRRNIDVSSVGHHSYGAVIDQNGILWSAGSTGNNILRLDPATGSFTRINIGHIAYGLGLDRDNHLFVSGWTKSRFSRINIITGQIEWGKHAPYQSRGVVISEDGDVWIANSGPGTVTRYSNNGEFKATIAVGKTPTGVSVDNNGKIWVVNNGDEYIHRIDPLTNQLDLSKAIPGTRHYGYSDMTGAVSQSITTQKGSWTVIHDSETPNTPWGIINWTCYEPTNTQITIRVKSSNDKINWSPWEIVPKNELLNRTPPGRYLMVETTLQRFQGSISPILYDLTVKALVADLSIQVIGDSEVIAGEQQTYQITIKNQGPYQSTNTIFTGDVPLKNPEYSLDNGTTWNTWTGILNLGNFNNGDYKTLLITGLTPSWTNNSLKLVGRVLSDTMDINPLNNVCEHLTSANGLCDLSIKITDYPDPVTSGENLTYHLTIQNKGPSTARNVNITGIFSLQNPEYSLDGGSTWQSWTGHLNLGTFEPDSLKSLLLRGLVASSATGVLDCTAQVESDTPDTYYSNNICNESTLLKSVSNLSVTLSEIPEAVAGDKIITTITVANNGPSDAQDVTVSLESVLESLEEFMNNNWVPMVDLMNLGTIPAGETQIKRLRGTIPSALQGAVNIIARVNRTNTADAIVLLTRKSTQFQVNMETPDSICAGENIKFNLTVTNPGPSTAEKVILTGTLPLLNPQYSWDGIIWNPWIGQVNLSRIPGNQSMNIIFNGEVSPSLNGTFNFTTTILTENMDPQKFIGPPIGLEKIADLKITLTINNTHPHLDEDFKITIQVENQGPSQATQARVEYELPPGLEIIGNYIYDRQGNRWLLGDIPRGGIITLLLKGQARSLELLQPVAVAYGMEYDPDLLNNRDSSSLLAYLIPFNYTTLPVHAATYNSAPGDDDDPKTVPMQNTGVPLNIMNLLIVTVFLGVSTYKNKHLKNKKLFLLTTLFFALVASGAAFADAPPDTADLNPDTVRSGDLITIEANTTTSTTKVKVYLQDETYNMVKEADNIWQYKYITPQMADGEYPVLITAWNTSGGEKQFNLNFTIDNTPPLMDFTLNTDHLRAGDTLTLKVDSDPDTATIQALFHDETLNLTKETDGTWNLEYQIPTFTPDGLYTLILQGQDNLGNTATNYIPVTIDNTPLPPQGIPTLMGKITPDVTRSGEKITIKVFTGPETITLDAVIMGVTHQLTKQANGTWKLIYTIPNTPDGTYPVQLTATDNNGTQKNTTLSLTIDNTPPQLDATLTPELVRTGNIITITATTSSDAEKVTAVMFGETLKLKKQSPNTWMLRYAVPTATDGSHNIHITATDKAGNQAQATLTFRVDNTPPTLNSTLNQTLVKSGDKITITTTADTDTQSVKAYIQDNTYQLTKNQDNTWSMEYTTPQIGDGVYSILLMAQDMVGNTNHTPLTFTVDNTPPVINPEIKPEAGKPGENITITVTTSPDTQNVVAIIGTQRINLTPTNGIWTTNYTIPLDATFDIHTIRIEGTDTVGNIGKNTASYEVVDPNPIPSWLEDLINPDTPNPGNIPGLITNTGSENDGGSNNPGSGTIGGNDQLYRDQMYIRNTLTYTPSTDPNANTTTPEIPGWEIDTSIFDALILAACMVASGLIGEELAKREFGGPYGKTTIKDLMQKGPVTPERIMIASFIATSLSPPTLKAEILLVTGLLVYFFTTNGFTMAGKTNAYTILSLILFITSLAMLISSLRKNAGKAFKESVLGQIFELLKKFFS